MDMTKLTPAPWEVRTGPDEFYYIPHADGLPMLLPEDDEDPADLAALRFAALARNAFDVAMRRRWGARVTMTGWNISNTLGMLPDDGGFNEWLMEQDWPDPFTALVEADAWMKEQEDRPSTVPQ